MSAGALRVLGSDVLRTITHDDLFPGHDEVLGRGWVVDDEAVLLAWWRESYHGSRARFAEIIDYEIAVNGRGIPDSDLTEDGEDLVVPLLRRGVAFAWAALHVQHRQLSDVRMAAYVSAAPVLLEPDRFTGNVTFCALRPGQPQWTDPARSTDEEFVIALYTEDCRRPLPAGR